MSFYNTQNPSKFVRQNENVYTQQHIQFLKSGFQQALPVEVSGYQVVYSAFQLVENRFITRVNLGDNSVDYTASAAEIIAQLNKDQNIRATAQDAKPLTVQPGFHVDFCIYNEDPDYDILVYGGSGVSIGVASDLLIPSHKLVDCRLHVTSVVEGQEEVYISVLTNLYGPITVSGTASVTDKFAKPAAAPVALSSAVASACKNCGSSACKSCSKSKSDKDSRRVRRAVAPIEPVASEQVIQQ